MSLRNQLFWGISLIFFVMFAGLVGLSVNSSSSYLRQQLTSQAQEMATQLARDIAEPLARRDIPGITALVDAQFSRGDYQSIRVLTSQGVQLVARTAIPQIEDVPDWFVNQVSLRSPMGYAIVAQPGEDFGRVRVDCQPTLAYQHLWRSSRDIAGLLGGLFLLSQLLLHLFLRHILGSLDAIEAAATALGQRRFEPIARIPRSRELRRVVLAMNDAARLISGLLDTESRRVESLRQESFVDPVSGLENRRSFNLQMGRALKDDFGDDHSLAVLEIDGLREYNLNHGHGAGDDLLRDLAARLKAGLPVERLLAARIGGGSFAVYCPGYGPDELKSALDVVLAGWQKDAPGADGPELALHAGVTACRAGDDAGQMLARADLALEKGRQAGGGQTALLDSDPPAGSVLGSGEWRKLIQGALQDGHWALFAQPVRHRDGGILHHEVTSRLQPPDGMPLPAEHFIPMAQRHHFMAAVDKSLVTRLLERVRTAGTDAPGFALNLSRQAIADREFIEWLESRLLLLDAGAGRLAFEVSDLTCQQAPGDVLRLKALLHSHGARLGVDHFGFVPRSLETLRTILPNYIKLDGALTRELALDDGVRPILRGLVDIAHSLGVLVIAQRVESGEIAAVLQEEGTDGVQGFHFGRPEALA